MTDCYPKRSQILAALAVWTWAIGATVANAEVTSVVESTLDFSITQFREVANGTIIPRPSDLVISMETMLDGDSTEGGAGMATVATQPILPVDPNDVGAGDRWGMELGGTATATTPPPSYADSVAIGDLTIRFDASELTTDVAVGFTVNFQHAVEVTANDPAIESGLAESFIEVFFRSSVNVSAIIDGSVFSDSSFGGGLSQDSDAISFEVVIPSGTSDAVLVGLIDQGAFVTAVPEPAGATALCILLYGVATIGRRKRNNGTATDMHRCSTRSCRP